MVVLYRQKEDLTKLVETDIVIQKNFKTLYN